MNWKGGVNWGVLLAAPAAIILIIAIFPVLNELLGLAFTTIDTSANVFYGNLIKLLLGSIGLILGFGLIWTVIKNLDTRSAEFGPPPDF